MISRAKQQYYEQKLAVTDQKTCFRVVSELLDTAGTTLPDSNNNQNLCDDFAKFFSDKITLIRENIQRRVHDVDSSVYEGTARSTVQYTLGELAPTTDAELIRILTNSSDKTCCLDAIPTNLIKKSLSLHIPYLVAIVNNSFKEGLFPSALRIALVRPLLKKDNLDRNTLNNYRPISNIPFISKRLEKVAVIRLVEHLSKNNLTEEYQSAYRADHSTDTALLKVHNDISSALDESQAVVHVILDLSAAFDTIDQSQLLSLLNAECGVHDKALSWLETYLEARTQRVKIDDAISEPIPLTCGVPQGSVLGPILYTIYTMPMQRIVRKHGVVYHKYADDTQLYNHNVLGDMQSAVKQLEDCIAEIRGWMINRMLKLNDSKTEMVIYMSQYHLNKYGRCDMSIGNSTISPVECVKPGIHTNDFATIYRRRGPKLGAKTIKKNTNSTQNKSETHHAKQYEVTSFLSTDCELSTETCSKNVYSLGPRSRVTSDCISSRSAHISADSPGESGGDRRKVSANHNRCNP